MYGLSLQWNVKMTCRQSYEMCGPPNNSVISPIIENITQWPLLPLRCLNASTTAKARTEKPHMAVGRPFFSSMVVMSVCLEPGLVIMDIIQTLNILFFSNYYRKRPLTGMLSESGPQTDEILRGCEMYVCQPVSQPEDCFVILCWRVKYSMELKSYSKLNEFLPFALSAGFKMEFFFPSQDQTAVYGD